jgi:DNA polymerase-3 subunit beta
MKFSIHRDPLFQALQKTQSVVEKRNTVQILGNILCSVEGQTLSIAATDLEVGIKITLPIEGSQNGKITLSAKNLLDIVKELPSKNLAITKKDNQWVEIICGKSKFNIVSLPADEFPALPQFEEKNYIDSKVDALNEMIHRTSFAVATDPTRYHLNGVFFEPLENSLIRMTATDGHRLSFVDQEVFMASPELKRGVIIPRKGLSELKKLLDEGASTIGLSFERGYVFARLDGLYLFVRLIEGEYPDYRQVVPKSTDRKAMLPREELTSALKRVSLLANEKSRGVKLSLQNALLTIFSSNPEMGEAKEDIDVQYQGETVEIGFNAKYLLDCLSVMTSEQIEFHFKDRLSPGILRESDKNHHTYVIMPMRI